MIRQRPESAPDLVDLSRHSIKAQLRILARDYGTTKTASARENEGQGPQIKTAGSTEGRDQSSGREIDGTISTRKTPVFIAEAGAGGSEAAGKPDRLFYEDPDLARLREDLLNGRKRGGEGETGEEDPNP